MSTAMASVTSSTSVPPRIVVLREGRAGDDRQLVNLAEALGRPYEVIPFRIPLGRVILDRVMDALRISGQPAGRESWGPPWPDLVLASGGRAVSAAVRLRRVSGGRTKIVFIGRPWAKLDHFDLIITTPQYRLPDAANVVQNLLPLNYIPHGKLESARETWRPQVGNLPGPYVTVLLGGNSSSAKFDPATAKALAERAAAQAKALGGSVLATSSPRTPSEAIDAFETALGETPARVYRWQANDDANPLTGYLGLAERILVTGESASMLAEAHRTGKPVEVMPLPQRKRAKILTRPFNGRAAWLAKIFAPFGRWLVRSGLVTPPRDLSQLHTALARETTPVESAEGALRQLRRDDDLRRAVTGVESLLARHAETTYKAAAGHQYPDVSVRPVHYEQSG